MITIETIYNEFIKTLNKNERKNSQITLESYKVFNCLETFKILRIEEYKAKKLENFISNLLVGYKVYDLYTEYETFSGEYKNVKQKIIITQRKYKGVEIRIQQNKFRP